MAPQPSRGAGVFDVSCIAHHQNSLFQAVMSMMRKPQHGSEGQAATTSINHSHTGVTTSLSALHNQNSRPSGESEHRAVRPLDLNMENV